MFPSFESNQDRMNKRIELYNRYSREIENDELKRQAYATALWASDQEKNKFNILGRTADMSTQTGINNASTGTQTSNNMNSSSTQTSNNMNSSGTQTSNNMNSSGTQTTFNMDYSGTQTDNMNSSDTPTDNMNSSDTQATEDIGQEGDSMSDIDDTDNSQMMQVRSHIWVYGKFRTGISTQVDIGEESKQLIDEILKRLPWIDTLDIKPIQNYKTGARESDSYKFGDNFEIYTIKGNKKVSGKAKSDLMKQINWNLTLNQIIEALVNYHDILADVLDDKEIALKNTPDEYKRMLNKKREIGVALSELKVKRANRDIDESVLDDFQSANLGYQKTGDNYPNVDYGTTYGKIVGRGLKGAGGVGLRGYSSTSKNLRSIQGSGSASDLKYKQLGSKFIRITDLRLDPPKLKLVYPNRTQVGKIIEISKPLAKCIEHLAFEHDVNQQMYSKLKINDKQAIHDLLRLCHLDTTFLNPIADPLETLQAEYDKLRSQVMLGNDNPDNIRELKTLSLDLYNKNLLSEDQMREILSL